MASKSNCGSWQGKPPDKYQESCPIPFLINHRNDHTDRPCSDHSDHRNDRAVERCSADSYVYAVPTPAVYHMSSSLGSNDGDNDRSDRSGPTNGRLSRS